MKPIGRHRLDLSVEVELIIRRSVRTQAKNEPLPKIFPDLVTLCNKMINGYNYKTIKNRLTTRTLPRLRLLIIFGQ